MWGADDGDYTLVDPPTNLRRGKPDTLCVILASLFFGCRDKSYRYSVNKKPFEQEDL